MGGSQTKKMPAKRNIKKTDQEVSRVLQDTFDELQDELLRQRRELEEEEGEESSAAAESVEEMVTNLAKHEGFEVKSLLGAGGMGAVVQAVDTKLKRTVALKFLPPEILSDLENARELRHEAEIASRIQNENVVQIFSWHEVDNVPFYAMEYIEGETAEQVVTRRGRLPTYEALRITSEAARGLEALHKAGIIHRDIKPQNILISKDGRVKITDFGISRTQDMISSEVLKTRRIAGTPKFMAPEQARGEAATKHSDIYSLGATLYYMLTGRPPVETALDIREQIKNVRESKLIPVTNQLPKLNRDIARLVMRCMSPIQAKRPWDVETFRQELDRAFLSQTLKSRSRIRNFIQQNRRIIIAVVSAVGGTVVGFAAGYQLSTIRHEAKAGPPVAIQPIAARESARFEEMLRVEPRLAGLAEFQRLRDELREAQQNRDNARMAQLLPLIAEKNKNWNTLQTIRREAYDSNSPLRDEARFLLESISEGDAKQLEGSLEQWREMWHGKIRETRENAASQRNGQAGPTASDITNR